MGLLSFWFLNTGGGLNKSKPGIIKKTIDVISTFKKKLIARFQNYFYIILERERDTHSASSVTFKVSLANVSTCCLVGQG